MDIQIEAGPGGGKRATQREMLREYALNLKNSLPTVGLTLARVIQEIKSMQHAETTMDVYGPSRTGRYTSFLKLFPTLFEIVGSGANIRVLPKAPEPIRSPVQLEPASSSNERTPRFRRSPNLFPSELKIRFSSNPARPGAQRFGRVGIYKSANTIGEARRLGALTHGSMSALAVGAMTIG